MNLNLSSAVRTVKSVITANSPVLLVGAAVAGVVSTGVLAAKGGYKARGIIDAEQARRDEEEKSAPLTTSEKAKLTWLCYAAPGVTAVSTVASVLGVHLIHNKRHAALAGLYAVATGKLDDYREEAEALLGPKKSQELSNVLGQKAADGDPIINHEVIVTSGGNELCYDQWGGRYFNGSLPVIEHAVAEVNLQLAENGTACVNDFYDHLGLPPTDIGAQHGWMGPKRIEVRTAPITASDGRSAISYRFHKEPANLARV